MSSQSYYAAQIIKDIEKKIQLLQNTINDIGTTATDSSGNVIKGSDYISVENGVISLNLESLKEKLSVYFEEKKAVYEWDGTSPLINGNRDRIVDSYSQIYNSTNGITYDYIGSYTYRYTELNPDGSWRNQDIVLGEGPDNNSFKIKEEIEYKVYKDFILKDIKKEDSDENITLSPEEFWYNK